MLDQVVLFPRHDPLDGLTHGGVVDRIGQVVRGHGGGQVGVKRDVEDEFLAVGLFLGVDPVESEDFQAFYIDSLHILIVPFLPSF